MKTHRKPLPSNSLGRVLWEIKENSCSHQIGFFAPCRWFSLDGFNLFWHLGLSASHMATCSGYITSEPFQCLKAILSSKAQDHKYILGLSKPYHVGIHWIALAEYSQMSTHMPRFQSFFLEFGSFVLAKLVTSNVRVNQFWHLFLSATLAHAPLSELVQCISVGVHNSPQLSFPLFLIQSWLQSQDYILTLLMLRLLSSKAQGCKYFWKTPKPCHIGTHWIGLAEHFLMSTNLPGFQ